jgi:hypothetical protein
MTNDLSIRSIVERRVAAFAVTLFTIGFWLVIATFPNFFFFNPLETTDPVFRVEQVISTIAWIVYATLPLLFAWVRTINSKSTQPLFLAAVGLWPLSILIIQVTMAVRGYGFYSYLSTYPILAFTDLVAPLVFIAMAKAVYSVGNNK